MVPLIFDLVLADGEAAPSFVLTRFPQRDFWSPSALAFVAEPTDAVMPTKEYPPGSPLPGVASICVENLPDPVEGEYRAVKLIGADGKPSSDAMAFVIEAPHPRIAVAVSVSVSR